MEFSAIAGRSGSRTVGRIYRINAYTEQWRWGVHFMLTRRKSYGTADTREEAMAAFPAETSAGSESSDE